jgi:hypothetical protein
MRASRSETKQALSGEPAKRSAMLPVEGPKCVTTTVGSSPAPSANCSSSQATELSKRYCETAAVKVSGKSGAMRIRVKSRTIVVTRASASSRSSREA